MNPPHHQHPQQHYAAHPHPNHPHHHHHGVPAPAPPQSFTTRKRSMSNDSEEQTWHSFKRLRLQTSDESSYQSSSGEDSVYKNHHISRGSSHPNYVNYNHNNLQHQHQHAGQVTSSSESYNHAHGHAPSEEDYSQVNHFLGHLHQQRRQRIQQEGAASTSEWRGQQTMAQNPLPPYNNAPSMPPVSQQRRQQRRHAVRLPSDSKLL